MIIRIYVEAGDSRQVNHAGGRDPLGHCLITRRAATGRVGGKRRVVRGSVGAPGFPSVGAGWPNSHHRKTRDQEAINIKAEVGSIAARKAGTRDAWENFKVEFHLRYQERNVGKRKLD